MLTVTEKVTLRQAFDEFCQQQGLQTAILYVEDTPTEHEELIHQQARILPYPKNISAGTVDNAILFISQNLQ